MAAAAAVFLLCAWGFAGEYSRDRELSKEIVRLQAEASALEEGNVKAAEKARSLAGDQAAEREARLKLGLMRPGEEVLVIRGDPQAASPAAGAPPPSEPPPVWRKWWNYFFH